MKKQLLAVAALFFGFTAMVVAQNTTKEAQARAWIKSNAKELKITSDADLNLRFSRKSLSGETLRFQQMVNGVPVFDSELVVHFSPSGEITHTDFNAVRDLVAIHTVPQISKENAVQIADKEIGVSGMVTFQEIKLFVYTKLGAPKLVYRTVTSFEEKSGSWEVIIDAANGQVLSVKDIAIYCGSDSHEGHNHSKETEVSKNQKYFMPVESTEVLAFESGSAMVFLSDPLSGAHVAYGAYRICRR